MNFSIHISGEHEHTLIHLLDVQTGTKVQVFAYGAILNGFTIIQNGGEEVNAIDGFSSIDDAIENMEPMFKSAKLSPFACRIKNGQYTFGETDYSLSKFSLGNNAIHGLIYDSVFSVTDQQADEHKACVTLQTVYNNIAEGYPFCYRCEVSYTLESNSQLTISTTVTNLNDSLMPVADGWHPYFALGAAVDDCQLEFQSKTMLEFDNELIPTGRQLPYEAFGSLSTLGNTRFDNCFTLNFAECQPMCVFRNPVKQIQLEIHPDESYPYLQIYTPNHRQSIAIENLSAAPDSLNNSIGLKILEPNEAATFSTKFVFKSL